LNRLYQGAMAAWACSSVRLLMAFSWRLMRVRDVRARSGGREERTTLRSNLIC